jgi:hypothetical protein
MDLVFEWQGVSGSVHVEVRPNTDPQSMGCPPVAQGFPVCTATVDYPHRGYSALFGWVQLVRSTDNESGGGGFEMDPFALFADATSPYCWYGLAPVLFDAPFRARRDDLDWECRSFLATTPLAEAFETGAPRVVPLAGFTWSFDIVAGEIAIGAPAPLAPASWDDHLETFRGRYPAWQFAEA